MLRVYLLTACLSLFFSATAQHLITFTPNHDLQFSPVVIRGQKYLTSNASYEVIDPSGHHTPVQLLDSSTIVFIPKTPLKAGHTYHYRLSQTRRKKSNAVVSVSNREKGLSVRIAGKPVLFYHTAASQPPADSPVYYRRSGFIHPLYSPSGKIMTDDFPAGHAHQHAVFTAWTNTRFRNRSVDFWNQHQLKGTVEHAKLLSVGQGPVFASFQSILNHVSLQDGVVLEETWIVKVYPFKNYYLIDLESQQRNVTPDTLFLNRYHYGGLAFRGSREWNPDDKKHFRAPWKVITSEGREDSAANAYPAKWVDASGKIGGQEAGVTIFNHPSNLRFPQPIRVHPYMPYWCYAPTADEPFYIAPGNAYRSQYRFLIHEGKADLKFIDQLFTEYAGNVQADAQASVR